jgi:hypothetical protein
VVYHHGPVLIYSAAGLGVKLVRDGFYGNHHMGLGSLGDALWGAAIAGLVLILCRQFGRGGSTVRDVGLPGVGLSVLAVATLIGAVLFGLRLMPGPTFTAGAALTALVILIVERKWLGKRLVLASQFLITRRPDPLVFLGILAGIAGLAIGIHAAWTVDVVAVKAILRAVSTAGSE